jgi:hypothetical protein
MHDREGNTAWPERFLRQSQHHHRVLAPGEEQDRTLELRRHFPNDVDRLCFDALQLRQLVLT